MITKEELRVGNAIQYDGDGTNAIVKSIEEHGIGIEFKEEETWIEYDQFSGIPITDKLLEKLGFKEQCYVNEDQDEIDYWYYEGIDWILDQGYQPIDAGFPMIKYELMYIHQLQNLYFSLTGKELIFEL